MPLPNNSLRYVLVYLFETDRGPYLIDAGWNTDDAFGALRSGMERPGATSATCKASWSRTSTPTTTGWPAASARLRVPGSRSTPPTPSSSTTATTSPTTCSTAWRPRCAAWARPRRSWSRCSNAAMPVRPLVDAVVPDLLLEDGARPEVPGWDLQAIWTPGHSPGHLCFYEARQELMLSGDHVLPRITPNIPFHPQAGANPLGDYLQSLDKLEPYRVGEVLPAHEYRFDDLCKPGSRSFASTTGTASAR